MTGQTKISALKIEIRALSIFYSISGLLAATWPTRNHEIQSKLLLSDSLWGTILASLPTGLIIAYLFSSWLVIKYNGFIIMNVCSIISSVNLFFLSISNSATQITILLFTLGFTRNILNLSMNTSAAHLQKTSEKPLLSFFLGIWTMSTLVAVVLGTIMISMKVSPDNHFMIISIICIITSVYFSKTQVNQYHKEVPKVKVKKQKPYFYLLALICFCAMMSEGAIFSWGVNYFKKVFHVNGTALTSGYFAFIIGMLVGRFLGDKIISKFGSLNILVFNGLLLATGYLVAVTSKSLIWGIASFLIIGLAGSTNIPIVYSLCTRLDRIDNTYTLASVSLIGNFGFIVSPILIGMISDIRNIQWSYSVLVIISLIISASALILKKQV